MSRFNFQAFNLIVPFTKQHPLHPKVMSDHVELILRTPKNIKIKAWNISNEKYAGYFNQGPFKHTHLFVPDSKNFQLYKGCINDQQINMFVDQLNKNEFDVQVIIEGYLNFYNELSYRLEARGISNYEIFAVQRGDKAINSSGILTNKKNFQILRSGIITKKYVEGDQSKEISIPFVFTSDNLIICAVHVSGCDTQFPKEGLLKMAEIINELKEAFPGCDIVAMGDFNTPPRNIEDTILKKVTNSHLLVAPYPTHVNPYDQATNYDNVVIVADNPVGYELLTSLSEPNQALVKSIKRNRDAYLSG